MHRIHRNILAAACLSATPSTLTDTPINLCRVCRGHARDCVELYTSAACERERARLSTARHASPRDNMIVSFRFNSVRSKEPRARICYTRQTHVADSNSSTRHSAIELSVAVASLPQPAPYPFHSCSIGAGESTGSRVRVLQQCNVNGVAKAQGMAGTPSTGTTFLDS